MTGSAVQAIFVVVNMTFLMVLELKLLADSGSYM
jgi:hypothetical protein